MVIKWVGMALIGTFFQQPQVEEWPLNTKKFQIPIRVKQDRKEDIKELVLYVSRDKGKTWEISSKAAPSQEAFTHHAKEDGNYWFSVVVVDHKGKQEPPEIHAGNVGQKVIVDTQKPEIRLKAEKVGEEIRVKWEIKEDGIDLQSLKLDCKIDGSDASEWVPISIKPAAEGTGTFKVQGAGSLTIRLQASDLAGNFSSAIQDIGEVKQNNLVSEPNLAPMIPPMEPLKKPAVSENPVLGVVPPIPATNPDVVEKSPPFKVANSKAPSFSSPVPAPNGLENQSSPIGSGVPVFPVSKGNPGIETPGPTAAQTIPSWNHGATNGQQSPVLASSVANSASVPAQPHNTLGGSKRVLPQLQIVSKRQVRIDYEVAKHGPSGIGAVEVYGTTDDGQTWSLVHTETPQPSEIRSPSPVRASVQVPIAQEGVPTGFYLLVKSKAGLSKAPPVKGDLPHIRVEVDTTFPEATLYGPQSEPGQRDSLVLTWKASDKNLATNPISLEWSERKEGPWNPIGPAELPNTGRYSWAVAPNMPHSVYLRLTVRDSAQNTAVAQTQEPLLIDLNVPEVNVLGVSGSTK